ncbi:MAG TPA: UPF0262 family protein [Rickettsiales bacterium]|nr:UPF0262 family protein [Rickettsiales bacterium]
MSTSYIASIEVDESSITRRTDEIEHERNVAINDLIEWNHFIVKDADGNNIEGPYNIVLGTAKSRITLSVTSPAVSTPVVVPIIITPFRSLIRDYFLICESYFDAVKSGNLQRIEAIDMSRRGLHNEGADLLTNLTAERVNMDSETARRLFTLVCALHLK